MPRICLDEKGFCDPATGIRRQAGKVDHNITKVVSGVAITALAPTIGASQTVRILNTMA